MNIKSLPMLKHREALVAGTTSLMIKNHQT